MVKSIQNDGFFIAMLVYQKVFECTVLVIVNPCLRRASWPLNSRIHIEGRQVQPQFRQTQQKRSALQLRGKVSLAPPAHQPPELRQVRLQFLKKRMMILMKKPQMNFQPHLSAQDWGLTDFKSLIEFCVPLNGIGVIGVLASHGLGFWPQEMNPKRKRMKRTILKQPLSLTQVVPRFCFTVSRHETKIVGRTCDSKMLSHKPIQGMTKFAKIMDKGWYRITSRFKDSFSNEFFFGGVMSPFPEATSKPQGGRFFFDWPMLCTL